MDNKKLICVVDGISFYDREEAKKYLEEHHGPVLDEDEIYAESKEGAN